MYILKAWNHTRELFSSEIGLWSFSLSSLHLDFWSTSKGVVISQLSSTLYTLTIDEATVTIDKIKEELYVFVHSPFWDTEPGWLRLVWRLFVGRQLEWAALRGRRLFYTADSASEWLCCSSQPTLVCFCLFVHLCIDTEKQKNIQKPFVICIQIDWWGACSYPISGLSSSSSVRL